MTLPGLGDVWILDSSAAINFKSIPIDRQWEVGERLLVLVSQGLLKFPAPVHHELTDPGLIQHPDLPGAWAARAWQMMSSNPSPTPEAIRDVLRSHPELIDGDARFEADPYVVALALEHARNGYSVTVIADDSNLRTACEDFAIPTMTSVEIAGIVLRA